MTQALDAQDSPDVRLCVWAPPGEPNLSSCTKKGLLPPQKVLGYLHRGPPWARPGLVQFMGVLWWPGPAHIHVTAATVQLKAMPA